MYEHNYDFGRLDGPSSRGRRIPREWNVDGGHCVGDGREPVEREALEEGVSHARRALEPKLSPGRPRNWLQKLDLARLLER